MSIEIGPKIAPKLTTATGHPRAMPGIVEFPCTAVRLANGNTLIADAGDEISAGSEVVEVDPAGQIVWRYGDDLRFVHSAMRLENGNTLIADTTNDRVIEVSPDKDIVFTTDELGTLSDGTRLEYINCAMPLPDGRLLVTDRNNDRCLIVSRDGEVTWQYGELKHPHNAEMLANGHILIADSDGNRIVEVTRRGEVAWSYGDGSSEMLNWPRHARRLDNGNTLITDSKNARVIEVTPEGKTAWSYQVDYFSKFYAADKLGNGNVLISDQQGHRVFEVDPAGSTVWMFRNYVYPNPIYPRLRNGAFKERTDWGWPKDWILVTRLSEGGGKVIWDEGASPRPAPGMAYDRGGALLLQQTVQAVPGVTYHLAGQIRTEGLDGFAFFQMAFVDELGAAIRDAPDIPRGRVFSGTENWTQDSLQARAPERATAMEVRLFITGQGKAWMKGMLLHT
ncbi:MAG: PQQ-binding-like beta-propeller repeat protein [Anaerolineae bacterium]